MKVKVLFVFYVTLPSLTVYQEFDRLLEEQSPIEAYIEWLDSMVDRCVVKVRQLTDIIPCFCVVV